MVKRNTYSVPPRLIGEQVRVRLFELRVEVWHSGKRVLEMPRLLGKNHHHIDYRHVIDSLLRKPGAFYPPPERCHKGSNPAELETRLDLWSSVPQQPPTL